jgi:AcrR family transcriptional regulator
MSSSINDDGYHRINLRHSLIEKALELSAKKQNIDALSIREIAREAGVSHTAPYRHFIDKEALLVAMAERISHKLLFSLTETLNRAQRFSESPILSVGLAYMQFAATHPCHFTILFREAANKPSLSSLQIAKHEILGLIVKAMTLSYRFDSGINAKDINTFSIAYWSLVHGLSLLHIGHNLPSFQCNQQREICAIHEDVLTLKETVLKLFLLSLTERFAGR